MHYNVAARKVRQVDSSTEAKLGKIKRAFRLNIYGTCSVHVAFDQDTVASVSL